jgi:hypothetical protein
MPRFAAWNCGQPDGVSSWSNLERFLLHFRNLIEFFGKPANDGDTLSILKPESFSNDQQLHEGLKKLYRNDLWTKYEVRHNGEENDKISRYLQHCTEERVNDKSWKTREMFVELSPLLEQFEKALPDKHGPWRRVPDIDLVAVATMQESCGPANVTKGSVFLGLNPIVEKKSEPE